MKNSNFVAFILTHGRADKVYTYKSLKKHGYTGRIIVLIDDEDKTRSEYEAQFGSEVMVFDKKEIAKTFDGGDNFNDRRAIIYARNASFQIAKELGIKHFIQLDDDYTRFAYKFNEKMEYQERDIKDLDRVLDALIDYSEQIYGAGINCASVALAQNGDFIGGGAGTFATKIKPRRKCMNTFICSTERPFQFVGRINEDVNTYVLEGGRGRVFLTIPNVAIAQKQTQGTAGGMTELYLDAGTYVKSFYSVMYNPSCVKISEMGSSNKRLHHQVKWRHAVPVIIGEELRKPRAENIKA